MPLTIAEKSKRYREKLKLENPQKYAELQRKAKERSARNYKKKMNDEKQKEDLRRKWREAGRKKVLECQPSSSKATHNTTPNVNQSDLHHIQKRIELKFSRQNAQLRSDLDKLLKGFKNLQKKLVRQQQKLDAMMKNMQKLAIPEEQHKEVCLSKNLNTPRKRVIEYINNTIPEVETPKKNEIMNKLLEHGVLSESIKSQFKSSNNTEKDILKKIVNNDIIKKYKLKSKIGAALGINHFKRREQKSKNFELKKKIEDFFTRDDVSRATAGKKEYRTYKKITRQKRYLLDTLRVLHQKFITEEANISFSTFKKYRPFHVLFPKVKDCESCACIKHSNMQFLANELKSHNIIKTDNLNKLVTDLVCDFNSKNCMYNTCGTCSEKKLEADITVDLTTKANWYTWVSKEQEYEKGGEKKKVKKMVKIKKEGTLQELLNIFNSEIKKFKTHIFNFYYQYNQYKACINSLKDDEAVIHIDFSENFTCKYHEEIQAMHFIKEQITLHTGLIYLKDKESIPFCSISPENQHNPEAIWAHLDPVLNYIKNIPTRNIRTIHFFSDGPTTQYRQKKNFFLFSQNMYDYQFSHSSWSFFEAAHGKGAADGIGGAIKRTLDMKIAHGTDIPNAQTAFEVLSSTETSIKIFYIPAEKIKLLDTSVTKRLTPLPGTMKIHQVLLEGKLRLKYRELSCFCEGLNKNCECYSPMLHDFKAINYYNEQQDNRQKLKKREEKAGKSSKSRKKIRQTRAISSSSEENTDTFVEYADSDATCYMTDDSMSQNFEEDNQSSPILDLDEKTGYFKNTNPNRRVTVLSAKTIIPRMDISKKQKVGQSLNENFTTKRKVSTVMDEEEVVQAKVCKITEKENVTPLLQVRHTAQNFAYLDLSKTDIFKEKGENINKSIEETTASSTKKYSTEEVKEEIPENYFKEEDSKLIATKEHESRKYEDEAEEQETKGTIEYEHEKIGKEDNKQNFSCLILNDNVIVRYFQRRSWKYYVGYIMTIENREGELYFKIKYYKTVKNPSGTLKFIVQKKTDIDVVPSTSIVKKVSLEAKNSKEYYLCHDSDGIYFN